MQQQNWSDETETFLQLQVEGVPEEYTTGPSITLANSDLLMGSLSQVGGQASTPSQPKHSSRQVERRSATQANEQHQEGLPK